MSDVLIIDDHPVVAEGTRELIARAYPQLRARVCNTAAEALDALAAPHADWYRILLDLDVPGAYGLSLAKQIRDRGLQSRCCVITALNDPETWNRLDAMGFLGYIVKATPIGAFTDALRAVFNGERVFPQLTKVPVVKPETVRLTRRQVQILACASRGLSSKRIADALCLAVGTVDNHIGTAMDALGVGTRTHAVARAIELGLIDKAPASPPPAVRRGER